MDLTKITEVITMTIKSRTSRRSVGIMLEPKQRVVVVSAYCHKTQRVYRIGSISKRTQIFSKSKLDIAITYKVMFDNFWSKYIANYKKLVRLEAMITLHP